MMRIEVHLSTSQMNWPSTKNYRTTLSFRFQPVTYRKTKFSFETAKESKNRNSTFQTTAQDSVMKRK